MLSVASPSVADLRVRSNCNERLVVRTEARRLVVASVVSAVTFLFGTASALAECTSDVAGCGDVTIDASRITQGIDVDRSANEPYDLIEGKDTLARTQVTGNGSAAMVSDPRCLVRMNHSQNSFSVAAEWTGNGPPRLNATPVGHLDGSPVFNCWIPGTNLQSASYSVFFQATVDGNPETLYVGSRSFRVSRDLRLLIYPWLAPAHTSSDAPHDQDPEHTSYDAAVEGSILAALRELQRMWPLRAGIGEFNDTGRDATEGLRFTIAAPWQCPDDAAHRRPSGGYLSVCDTEARIASDDFMARHNALVGMLSVHDGLRRDRFDSGIAALITPMRVVASRAMATAPPRGQQSTRRIRPTGTDRSMAMSHSSSVRSSLIATGRLIREARTPTTRRIPGTLSTR